MNEKLKILICLLVFFIMPVVMGVIVAKAVANHNGRLLAIIFFSLITLKIILTIIRIIKYKKNKE